MNRSIRYILLLLIAVKASNAAETAQEPRDILRDRANAAILNAAIGDALGRITEFVDTTKKICAQLGDSGVTSLAQATIYHHGKTIAPYTDDTVMARIVLDIALQGRTAHASIQTMTNNLAHAFARLFGPERYSIDPLFELRAHGLRNTGSAEALNALIAQKKDLQNDWWLSRKGINPAAEGGCGSVMRAWPIGLVFTGDDQLIIDFAAAQSAITHAHPLAMAASAAMALGTAYAYQGKSVDEIMQAMIRAAEQFDAQELRYKTDARKRPADAQLTAAMIARNQLLTSDMIRYAYQAAQEGKLPEEVLGTDNIQQPNYRSPNGFLLGWAADEAVAGAVYLLARNRDNVRQAIVEGVNSPGDSDSLASLAGALVGAHTGNVYPDDALDRLENIDALKLYADQIVNNTLPTTIRRKLLINQHDDRRAMIKRSTVGQRRIR
jgi:ADP-ribosylglycohydrolase